MKKGVTIVFFANIINMVFSIITNFILPKYLSIESYGYYKVFQLYANYLGIAHLGFVDGIYLRYGGKNIKTLDPDEVLDSAATIRNMQIVLMICALVVSAVMRSPIAMLLSLSCVPINMISFYKNLYQATGEFKDYGVVLTALPMISFVCNVVLLFVVKTDNYIAYILVTLFSNLILYGLLEYRNSKLFGKIRLLRFNGRLFKETIVSGITLTIGNFASLMITSIDRWCIQILMTISDYSYYSFAVSVENLFNVCVSAVTTTLYNYLCKVKEADKIIEIKTYCVFTGIYLVSVAFPVKFIINLWLTKYSESIICLFVLICAHSFYFVIKSIYVNLYKARGQQKHYLCQILIVLAIALATNLFGYFFIMRTREVFAYASLLTAMIWYFMCLRDFKEIRGRIQETFLLLICSAAFLCCGLLVSNPILGFVIYIVIITGCAYLMCGRDFVRFFEKCFSYAGQVLLKFQNRRI